MKYHLVLIFINLNKNIALILSNSLVALNKIYSFNKIFKTIIEIYQEFLIVNSWCLIIEFIHCNIVWCLRKNTF